MNPYRGLPPMNFWAQAVSLAQHGQIDPVSAGRIISAGEKVATMGSCFAQHLARRIQTYGLNYFVAEQPPAGMPADVAAANNYGTFSARYGNIYTVRQALQLFEMAFEGRSPLDNAWAAKQGFVDPFRPRIDQHPKVSKEEVIASRAEHLGHVRTVFEASDWLVFTLGLTEAWQSREDGSIFPLAPGVAGGEYDPQRHQFVNFTASQVSQDLDLLFRKMRSVNGNIKMLLTVSPVSLVATYETRHVLQSTIFSKSALRVAADEVERQHEDVIYFPSYEIITSPATEGRYFEDDFREVTDIGVSHVMRIFKRHFIVGSENTAATGAVQALSSPLISQVVCDEEIIQRSMEDSGFR